MEDGAFSPLWLQQILNELMEAQAGTGSNSGVPAFVFLGRLVSPTFCDPGGIV